MLPDDPYGKQYSNKRMLWPLVICGLILLYVHLPYGHELFYPRHSWAQADRLALAMQFHDEGMDFFHPRTYNISSDDRITGVEFPLQSYAAAALGKVIGREAIPFIFRFLTTLAMLFGCVMLFRIVDEYAGHIGLSMIAPVFVLASPTVQHYTWSYLPDAFGAGLFLGALYFAVRMCFHPSGRTAMICVGLACTAALTKMSVAFYLPALCIWLFFRLQKRTDRFKLIALSALGASVLAAWLMYMHHLNESYHSTLFLAQPMPLGYKFQPEMIWWESVRAEWKQIFFYHGEELLTPVGYSILRGLGIIALIGLLLQPIRAKLSLYVLLLVLLIGSTIGTAVMGVQLIVHDYYAIVLWMPTVSITLAISAITLHNAAKRFKVPSFIGQLIGAALCIILIWPVQRIHLQQTNKEVGKGMNWLREAEAIPHDLFTKRSKAIFSSEEAPNLGQSFFDVKGMSRKLDLQKDGGLFKLLREAKAFDLTHAVLPRWQADIIKEDLACNSQWVDSLHIGNTYAVIRFKNIENLMPNWIIRMKDHELDTAYHIVPIDTCLNFPWSSYKDGQVCEQISPHRKYGFNLQFAYYTFYPKTRNWKLVFSYKNTNNTPKAKLLCIYQNKDLQKGILEHRIVEKANFAWKQDTIMIPIPGQTEITTDESQHVNCFMVNDHPTDTLWIKAEKLE